MFERNIYLLSMVLYFVMHASTEFLKIYLNNFFITACKMYVLFPSITSYSNYTIQNDKVLEDTINIFYTVRIIKFEIL